MDDQDTLFTPPAKREPWNKGKFTGAKPPLLPKHVWAIRTKLQVEGRKRDLAMFNLAIDSKLRGCDLVRLREPHGIGRPQRPTTSPRALMPVVLVNVASG